MHAVRLAGAVEGATALVLGLGTIGLQVTQVLQARGIGRILAVDLSALRCRTAASFGAEVVDLAGLGDVLAETDEIDLVFECSGVEPLATAAMERVRVGGTIVVIALYDDPLTLDVNVLVQKEIRVQGCIAYTSEDFAEATRAARERQRPLRPTVTHRESLDNVTAAFDVQLEKDRSIKVLIFPGA